MARTAHTAVPSWTATGHQLAWQDSRVDLHQERMLDDVIGDEWIQPSPRSTPSRKAATPEVAAGPIVAVLG
jgi:hypothetical protein